MAAKRGALAALMCCLAALWGPAARAETRITTDGSNQDYPSIWGNVIVWEDARNGNSDIYAYHTATTDETRITTNTSGQFYPDVSSSIITWDDFRNATWDIYYYDLDTGAEGQVVVDPAGQSGSACSGFRVVWTDTRAANADIYYKDLSTGSGKALITYMTHQTQPDISGDLAVWTDKRAGVANIDIWGYNLGTSAPFQVTTDLHNQQMPAISGPRVVWQDNRNGNWDIYMRDMSGGDEVPICTAAGDQTDPAIDGNIIVWTDARNGNPDIYMYDLGSAQEYPVCIDLGQQQHSAVSQGRVVWADNRNGNWDIYMADVGDPEPPSVALTAPAAGATVSATVNVTADASDNQGVERVDFLLDDVLTSSDASEPYEWLWNTAATADGTHALKARAYDPSGNHAEDARSAKVDNGDPSVQITAPAPGAWVSGTLNATADAVDAVAVNRVEFRVDGLLKSTDTAAPYVWSWNTLGESNGAHTLRATAYDNAGHSDYDEHAVSVDNTTPSVGLTAPADGATVKVAVDVTADASDTVSGLDRVEFYLDGGLVSTCTAPPYVWHWDAGSATEGSHVVGATAVDRAGNRATDTRGVTVDNATFDDVPKTLPLWPYVEALVREEITTGCQASPPLYCPDAGVTRAQMAKFLCIAAGKAVLDRATPTFADVPKTIWYYGYVERLADAASWGGTPPTGGCRVVGGIRYFCPNDPVTREQMAKFLCVATSKSAMPSCTGTFADVASGSMFCTWIERLADPASWGGAAVTSGCAAGPPRLYCPKANVTRGQMAVFLVRAFAIAL